MQDQEQSAKEFYRGQTFELLMKRFDGIESTLRDQNKSIEEIRSKMFWMYGWAAGVAAFSVILWQILKERISKLL